MRRLVAALTGKRSDKSDAASNASSADPTSPTDPRKATSPKRPAFFKSKSLSRSSATQQVSKQRSFHKPPVLTTAEHAPSSSSSSSGGPSTPHDDVESVGHPHFGSKAWGPLTYLHDKVLPPIAAQDPSRPYVPRTFTQDDDASSTKSDDMASLQLPPTARNATTSQPIMPSAYCRAIATNALEPAFSPPPLLVVPNAPLYPRSCNSPQQLRPAESLHYQLCQARILRRLESTPADRYLAPFANRQSLPSRPLSLNLDDVAIPKGHRVVQSSLGLRRWIERPCFEDRVLVYLPAENQNGVLRCERVSATAAVEALGYSDALDALAGMPDEEVAIVNQDLLAASPASLTPPLSSTPSTASFSSLPPSPAVLTVADSPTLSTQGTKPSPAVTYKSSPSPLRMDNTKEATVDGPFRSPATRSVSSPAVSTSPTRPASLTSSVSSPKIATPPVGAAPRVSVRFADDDRDENVPLDYVMRVKQAKDQKAKFLAAEHARRQSVQGPSRPSSVRPSLNSPQQMRDDLKRVAEERQRLEEEKKRYEAERRKQEEERRQYEKERAAWEKERKAAEEERKRKAYAEEVVEARRRRESSRQGSVPRIDNIASWTGDREKERERKESLTRPRYSRPKYESTSEFPRRDGSDGSFAGSSTNLRLHIPAESSPSSSRPPSIATGSVRDSSRPPSMYSTPPSSASAIDVRQRRESKTSRRTSFMSDGSAMGAQQMFMQGGMASGYSWGVPPVPPVPAVMNMNMMPGAMPVPMQMQMPMMQMPMMPYADMPLLPPSAPFMQQHGPRQHRSHSASPTRSSPASGSDRGNSTAGRSSPHGSHRRMPSDETPKRQPMNRSSSYAAPLAAPLPKQSSSASLHSSRPPSTTAQRQSQQQQPPVRPTPVQSRTQPAFQNLSRPSPDRRQTMIR